jgi:serine phosphatase RsbU (regulator of sigma subunit)
VIIRNGTIIELDADKMPVGKGERNESFRTFTPQLETGDMLYIFTDGYADQFGGPKGKKFKYANLYKLLSEIAQLPMAQQREHLRESFELWKGDLEQIDDVCIVGVRVGV